MTAIMDGLEVLGWDALNRFLKYCGVTLESNINGIEISLPTEGNTIIRKYRDKELQQNYQGPVSITAYASDEFKALCKKLNVNLELNTKSLKISIKEGALPLVTQIFVPSVGE